MNTPKIPAVGSRIYAVDGPGDFRAYGTVTAVVTDRWGTHAEVQMDDGETKTCHGLNNGPGIGWHREES